jgi:MoaA/NifB/PqqE/SkfB family radical SAM enzyme
MARGLKPVIHTFPGCRTFFPDEFLYRTVDEFCERILAGPYEPRAYRDFVAERFGLSKQLARVEALLAELEKQVPARTNAERGTWNAERQTRSAPRLTARPRQVPGSDFRVPSCRGRAGSERAIGGPGPSPGQTAAETRPSALRPGYAMAVWRITHRCNFRCAYCFGRDPAPEARGPARLDVYERLDDLIGRFAAAGRDWTFGFTGGEPLLYPHFPEICGALAEKFHIYLDTNLSVPIGPVLEAVPPDRMEQVFAACHIQERLARGNLEVFLANLRLLKEGGYPVAVNYVMYPPVIGRFEQDLEFFRARGFGLEPKSFKGVYGGRRYPRSYTPEERALIRRHAPHDRFAVEVPDYRGWRCNAGHKLVRILEDGTVVRCVSDKTVLGNVFEGFDLFEGPRACPATRCPCYDARILFDGLPDPSRAAREDGPCAAAPCPAAAGEGPT